MPRDDSDAPEDEAEGTAGVREPRRPLSPLNSLGAEADLPHPEEHLMAVSRVNALGRYREEHGLSYDELAERLTDALGKPVKAQGVKFRVGKAKVPPAWAVALGLETDDDQGRGGPDDDGSALNLGATAGEEQRAEGEPPKAPEGARRSPSPSASSASGNYDLVRKRIADAYGAVGAGASMMTHNDGYSVVADLYKNDLAAAWVSAAQENQNVAKIVQFMQSGGSVGELVVAHLILVMGFVYVSGRAPALGSIYGDKLRRYHDAAAVIAYAEAAATDAAGNGSAADGAAHTVANATG